MPPWWSGFCQGIESRFDVLALVALSRLSKAFEGLAVAQLAAAVLLDINGYLIAVGVDLDGLALLSSEGEETGVLGGFLDEDHLSVCGGLSPDE